MRKAIGLIFLLLGGAALLAGAEVNQDWLKRVPPQERARTNPYTSQADAIAAGGRLFADRCARCHGADLEGAHGKPGLKTDVVRGATDGELFWLLRNGDLRHGMPSWSGLPEPERWEIIAFLKSSR